MKKELDTEECDERLVNLSNEFSVVETCWFSIVLGTEEQQINLICVVRWKLM